MGLASIQREPEYLPQPSTPVTLGAPNLGAAGASSTLWTIHPPQGVLEGGGGCCRGGRGAGTTTALCLPSSLITELFRLEKTPEPNLWLLITLRCCHQRTWCSMRRWKQVVPFTPHSDIIPLWKPQHPHSADISGVCNSPSGSWWQQEVNSGCCLHGSREHSEGPLPARVKSCFHSLTEARLPARRTEFTTWTKQIWKTSIWITAQSHLF